MQDRDGSLMDASKTLDATPSNSEVIDWQGGVKRLMGNEKLFRKLLASFIRDYSNADTQLRATLEQDHQAGLDTLHTLKGVAGNLSLTSLHKAATEAEGALKSGSPANDELARLSMELRTAVDTVTLLL